MYLATTEQFRANYLKAFRVLNVAYGVPYASVQYYDGATENFCPPGAPVQSKFRAPVSTLSMAGPEIFLELADIVMKCRRQAEELGIIIPTDEMLANLNGPPSKPGKRKAASHQQHREASGSLERHRQAVRPYADGNGL